MTNFLIPSLICFSSEGLLDLLDLILTCKPIAGVKDEDGRGDDIVCNACTDPELYTLAVCVGVQFAESFLFNLNTSTNICSNILQFTWFEKTIIIPLYCLQELMIYVVFAYIEFF